MNILKTISYELNSVKYKKIIKEFIKSELAKLNIDRYYMNNITKEHMENGIVQINISACNKDRGIKTEYSCIGYTMGELQGVISIYVDSIIDHFKKLDIDARMSTLTAITYDEKYASVDADIYIYFK